MRCSKGIGEALTGAVEERTSSEGGPARWRTRETKRSRARACACSSSSGSESAEAVVECVEDAVRCRILARAVGQEVQIMIRVEPEAEVQGSVQVAHVAEDLEPVGEVHGEARSWR